MSRCWSVWGLSGLLALAGCGGAPADAPEAAPVKGKVTRSGAPLAGVSVSFQPIDAKEGQFTASTGLTNDAGEYELMLNRNLMGAVPGKHKVRLTKDQKDSVDDDGNKLASPVIIPEKYNTQTELEVEVPKEGLNGGAANFDLDF